jgi:hypothetical protein
VEGEEVSRILIPEIVTADAPLMIAPRGGELITDDTDKTLVRMVRLWEKLNEGQRKAFRRFIDGIGEIDTDSQLIGAAQAARILKTTFYEVKRMAREGALPIASSKETYYTAKDGDTKLYRFKRADILEYQRRVAPPSEETKGND